MLMLAANVLVVLTCIIIDSTAAQDGSQYICYQDSSCGNSTDRPVFTLADSFIECCGLPDVMSVYDSSANNCENCGSPTAERVTSRIVALYPPSALVLEVTATSYTAISWFVNGTAMHDFDDLVLEDNNKRFILYNTAEEDYGTYEADIHTSDDNVIVLDFLVYKFVSPDLSLSKPTEDNIINGHVNVTCMSHGNPIPDISINCDDVETKNYPFEIQEGEFGELSSTIATLQVTASQANGLKACYCIVSVFDGEEFIEKNDSIFLLATPPMVTYLSFDDTLVITAPLKLEIMCSASGRPVPTITWYRNGNEISLGGNNNITEVITGFVKGSSLSILPTSSVDYGEYFCNAKNMYGQSNSSEVLIDVQFPPEVTTTTPIKKININAENQVSFLCVAEGNPESQIIWISEGDVFNEICAGGNLKDTFGEAALDYGEFFSEYSETGDSSVPDNCAIEIIRDTSANGFLMTRSILTIYDLHLEKSLYLKCIGDNGVMNMIGATQVVDIILQLDASPYFQEVPREVSNLQMGDNVIYTCAVLAQPQSNLTIKWLKDGVVISEPDSRVNVSFSLSENPITVSGNSTLSISPVELNDAGVYTCQAVSNNGTSQYNFTQKVLVSPEITSPKDGLTYNGFSDVTTLTITCEATGIPAPNVTMTKLPGTIPIGSSSDPVLLDNGLYSVTHTISFDPVTTEDSGNYLCNVMNDAGSAEVTFIIDATYGVFIHGSLEEHQIKTGDTAILLCNASGIVAPNITWFHENTEVEVKDRISAGVGDSVILSDGLLSIVSELSISNVQLSDQGVYKCAATVEDFTVVREIAEVIVQVPVSVSVNPKTVNHISGSGDSTINCTTFGIPAPSLQFIGITCQYDLILGESPEEEESGDFTVTCISYENDGVFIVTAIADISLSSSFGPRDVYCSGTNTISNRNDTGTVIVQGVPQILSNTLPGELIALTGESFSLTCSASGYPAPNISWLNSGGLITDNEGIIITPGEPETLTNGALYVESNLTVVNHGLDLEGEYTCVATNTIGSVEKLIANVDSQVPVSVSVNPKTVNHINGSGDSTINCTTFGIPAPSIQFIGITCQYDLILGESPEEEESGDFTVTCISYENAGVFIVTAIADISLSSSFGPKDVYCSGTNSISNRNDTGTVIVQGLPQILSDTIPGEMNLLPGETFSLTCSASGYPAPNITWMNTDGLLTEKEGVVISSRDPQILTNNAVYVESTLTIVNNSLEYDGEYKCVATNSIGSTEKLIAIVNIQVPVSVSVNPKTVNHINGSGDSTINCTTFGIPAPTLQFIGITCQYDLILGESPEEEESGDFTVTCISYENAGVFIVTGIAEISLSSSFGPRDVYCSGTNTISNRNDTGTVIVQGVPQILSSTLPDNITVLKDGGFSLTCSASGYPAPTISWLNSGGLLTEKEGIIITPGEPETLINGALYVESNLTVVTNGLDYDGEYTCVATNIIGSTDKGIAIVDIQDPPVISSDGDAETRSLLVGSSLTRFCNATGLPAPTITWYRSDTVELGSGEISELGQLIVPGETIDIVTTMYSDGLTSYTTSVLMINGVQIQDEGTYRCVAVSTHGEDIKVIAQLEVQALSTVSINPKTVTHTVPKSTLTQVTCSGMGKPAPAVSFAELDCNYGDNKAISYDGLSISCGTSYVYEGLYIVSVVLSLNNDVINFGGNNFTCIASNGIPPVAMETAFVIIEAKEQVITSPPSIHINESETLTLQCTATGYPNPSIAWLYGDESAVILSQDRRNVTDSSDNGYTVHSTLIIVDVIPDDAGEYKCRAQYQNGHLIDSSYVTVEAKDDCIPNSCINGECTDRLNDYFCECNTNYTGKNCDEEVEHPVPPDVTEDPQNITETNLLSTFNLTCLASENPLYQWYRDGNLIYNDTKPILTITEALPEDRGYYTCVAVNEAGTSSSQPGLVVIPGIYQYVADINGTTDSNGTRLIDEVGECLGSSPLSGDFEETIIYSVNRIYDSEACDQYNGIAQALITLYQTEGPFSSTDLRDTLLNDLQLLKEKCGLLRIEVLDVCRFDGCHRSEQSLHVDYALTIIWPESDIGDTIIQPCPCGRFTESIYTNQTASRECNGNYHSGGNWSETDSSLCEYNDENINITLTLCHLTTVSDTEVLGSSLVSITEESTTFQKLDFTIASLVLEQMINLEEIRTDKDFQNSYLQSIDNLLSVDVEVIRQSQNEHDSARRILQTLESFESQVLIPDSESEMQIAIFRQEKFAVVIADTNSSLFINQSLVVDFQDSVPSNRGIEILEGEMFEGSHHAYFFLPETLPSEAGFEEDSLRISYNIFLSNALFQGNDDTEISRSIASGNLSIGDIVISANLYNETSGLNVKELDNGVIIEFTKPEYLRANGTNSSESLCVFWDSRQEGDYGWSTDGCELISEQDDDVVRCLCDHLTHFGYLLDVQPRETESEPAHIGVQIISYIGCMISIICLIITIITYCGSSKLHKRTQGKTLINMSIALIGMYLSYMVAANANDILNAENIRGDILCAFFGGLLYYFMLVYFMWTGLEAIDLYRKLVKVFGSSSTSGRFIIYGGIISWGVPLVIAVISVGAGHDYYVQYQFFCRPVGLPFYIGFLIPFGVIYIFNWIVFIIIIFSLLRKRIKHTKYTGGLGLKYQEIFFVAMVLSINFGLGWIFGLLATSQFPEPVYLTFVYLFSIFVGTQGVLIFVLHCARSKDARKTWKMWFYVLCRCKSPHDAKGLAKLVAAFNTPAIQRKVKSDPQSTSLPPISPFSHKNVLSESERGSFASPINDSDTLETFVPESGLSSPFELKNLNVIDIGEEIKVSRESKMSKRESKQRLSKSEVVKETRKDEKESRRLSKKQSKKMIVVESERKTSKLIEEYDDDDLAKSTYSLDEIPLTCSQVLEIEFAPTPDHSSDEEEETWKKLQKQFDNINSFVNTDFEGEVDNFFN